LNLVVGAKNFFGTIQRIYVLFSASVGRWHILKNNVKSLTVKPLCENRWECRIDCINAIKNEISQIIYALS